MAYRKATFNDGYFLEEETLRNAVHHYVYGKLIDIEMYMDGHWGNWASNMLPMLNIYAR